MTVPEFAALCRERCKSHAQGFDDGRACGSASEGDGGEQVFHFCGRHWVAVLAEGGDERRDDDNGN